MTYEGDSSKLYPPPNFCQCSELVYRSAFPSEQYNYPHLRKVGLTKVITLTYWPSEKLPEARTSFGYAVTSLDELKNHLETNSGNLSDFSLNNAIHMERQKANAGVVREILAEIKECEENGFKVLLSCASGKYLTSIVIGCWRKVHQCWAMSSIFEEMRRFQGVGSTQLPLEQFVEMYQ